MAIRKIYSSLVQTEREQLVDAIYAVKAWGLIDQYAQMHSHHFSHGIHRTSHFLPWHREFLHRFELALQQVHPDVAIPYWDSTISASPNDPLWDSAFLGQFDLAWNLGRRLRGQLPTSALVNQNQARGDYGTFWVELEGPIHSPPHNWVGGVMASAASPGDPVFYFHHAWIDLLWVRWQRSHPTAPFIASRPGFDINDPLMEWPSQTPADVMDHHVLGYTYDIE